MTADELLKQLWRDWTQGMPLVAAWRLPIATAPEDMLLLYEAAASATLPEGHILEVGTGLAVSTLALARGNAARRRGEMVLTLDTLVEARKTALAGAACALLAIHATGRYGIVYMQGDTAHLRWLIGERNRRFRIAFIDGDHTYDGLANDLAIVAPLMTSGGVIFVHDTGEWERWADKEPGCCRLWRSLREAGMYAAPDGRIWKPIDVSAAMGRMDLMSE